MKTLYIYNNSLSSSQNEIYFRQSNRENQNTYFMLNNCLPKIMPLKRLRREIF